MEAEVFQEQDFAVLEGGGELFDGGADAVVGEFHGLGEKLGEAGCAGLEGVFGFGSALGSAEVGHEDEASAAAEDVFDGGEGLGDAAVIGDFSGFEGDVEIDSHEDFFSADVHVGGGFFGHECLLDVGDATTEEREVKMKEIGTEARRHEGRCKCGLPSLRAFVPMCLRVYVPSCLSFTRLTNWGRASKLPLWILNWKGLNSMPAD